jgi:hypothetical protein
MGLDLGTSMLGKAKVHEPLLFQSPMLTIEKLLRRVFLGLISHLYGSVDISDSVVRFCYYCLLGSYLCTYNCPAPSVDAPRDVEHLRLCNLGSHH